MSIIKNFYKFILTFLSPLFCFLPFFKQNISPLSFDTNNMSNCYTINFYEFIYNDFNSLYYTSKINFENWLTFMLQLTILWSIVLQTPLNFFKKKLFIISSCICTVSLLLNIYYFNSYNICWGFYLILFQQLFLLIYMFLNRKPDRADMFLEF